MAAFLQAELNAQNGDGFPEIRVTAEDVDEAQDGGEPEAVPPSND